jgi:hypothetical protein
MRIVRVDKNTNIVVNIELSDQQWLDENIDDAEFLFISCDDEMVSIGSIYDKNTESFINKISLPIFDSAGVPIIYNSEDVA